MWHIDHDSCCGCGGSRIRSMGELFRPEGTMCIYFAFRYLHEDASEESHIEIIINQPERDGQNVTFGVHVTLDSAGHTLWQLEDVPMHLTSDSPTYGKRLSAAEARAHPLFPRCESLCFYLEKLVPVVMPGGESPVLRT